MRRDLLDALNRLHVLVPQTRTAQRFAPALLVLLVDDLLQLQRQPPEHIDVLLAVAHVRRHLLQHLQHQFLGAARQTGDALAGDEQPQQGADVLEASTVAHRAAKVEATHRLAQAVEAGDFARTAYGDVAVRRHSGRLVIAGGQIATGGPARGWDIGSYKQYGRVWPEFSLKFNTQMQVKVQQAFGRDLELGQVRTTQKTSNIIVKC